MIIKRLEIEGYRSYGECQVIEFQPGVLYILTGENRDRGISSAAGKSSVFKAITLALFEKTDDDCTHDSAINTVQPEKGCRIALYFEDDNGVNFSVVYARNHPEEGTHWTLFRWDGQDWQAEKGSRNTDTKKIIQAHIGMTYDQFVNQAYIPQSKVADFIERTDKERKAIFGNILDLDECDKYSKAASDWRKEISKEYTMGLGTVGVLKSQVDAAAQHLIPQDTVDEYEQKILEKELALNTLTEELAALEKEAQQLVLIRDLRTKQKILNEKISLYSAQCEEAYSNLLDKPASQFLEEYANITDQVRDLQQRFAMADVGMKNAEEHLQHAENLGSECPECEQQISKETRVMLRRKYTSDLRENKKKRHSLKEALEQSIIDQRKHQEYVTESQKRTAEFSVVNRQLSATVEELNSVNQEIEGLAEILGEGVDIPEKIEEERKTKTLEQLQLTKEVVHLRALLGSANLANAHHAVLLGQMFKQKVLNDANEKRLVLIERCESLIGDKGFKSFKINASKDSFNASIAKYLSILTEGEVQAELVTEVPKADGRSMKTELDILIKDGIKGKVPIKQYSGGEKASVSLAITGAFGDLSLEQSDANVNLLLLDEPFANLDSWGEEKMCQLLDKLTEDGRIVLAITNHLGVKERGSFDREIRAVKENHITHLEEYDLSGEH